MIRSTPELDLQRKFLWKQTRSCTCFHQMERRPCVSMEQNGSDMEEKRSEQKRLNKQNRLSIRPRSVLWRECTVCPGGKWNLHLYSKCAIDVDLQMCTKSPICTFIPSVCEHIFPKTVSGPPLFEISNISANIFSFSF